MDELKYLEDAKHSMEEYHEQVGCTWCKAKSQTAIDYLDNLIHLHKKAGELYEALQNFTDGDGCDNG